MTNNTILSQYDIDEIINNTSKFAKKISINKLEELLRYLSDVYFNTNESLVPDQVFDILKDELEERDSTNSFLNEIGSTIRDNKVKLPYFMGSLNKIKTKESLDKWLLNFSGPFIVSDKLDGVSCLLVKKNNKIRLYTRGNGEYGQNINNLVPFIIDKLPNINKIKNDLAIRGELIISKTNFNEIKDDYKNARNTVSGLVNSKTVNAQVAALTDFIAYNVLDPILTVSEQMQYLEKMGFATVYYKAKKYIDNDSLIKMLLARKNNSNYVIDGLVVTDDSRSYDNVKGNPLNAFAFKQASDQQIIESTVIDIEWNLSKYGYLKPRLIIEPRNIDGIIIQHATAFNAKYVIDNCLGPGAIVKIIRSGDVIPHIISVIKKAKKPKLPSIPFVWTKTGIDIVAKNQDDLVDIKIKKLTFFFAALKIKNISSGIVTKLIENGYDNVFKILDAKKTDLYQISGFGQTIIDKIYSNIDSAINNLSLADLMAASGIFGRGFGVRRLNLLLKHIPDIVEKKYSAKMLIAVILEVPGFDEIMAEQFVVNYPKFISFYNKIYPYVKFTEIKNVDVKVIGNLLANQYVVFSEFRDKGLEQFILSNGGFITNTVSKKTTLILCLDKSKMTSKIKKGMEFGVDVMTRLEFVDKYGYVE